MLERPGVPDDVVEVRLAYAGELRLVAVGDGNRAVERRAFRAGDVLPALRATDVAVVEGEAPLAVEVRPGLPAELRARVLGTRYGAHGCSPLPRSERWASGQYSRRERRDGREEPFPRRWPVPARIRVDGGRVSWRRGP